MQPHQDAVTASKKVSTMYQDNVVKEAIGKQEKTSQRSHLLIENDHQEEKPSNEYVLNVAFFSFLGFTMVQTGFALVAHSAAMLQDSEAMYVDSLTYLFNLLAERLKHRPYTEKEKQMNPDLRHYRRRLHRLYLELIPPFISVATLLVVTIFALRDSISVLLGSQDVEPETEADLNIMLFFSALNLGLDVVNVLCFSRAHQAVGLHAAVEISEAHHPQHSKHVYDGEPLETTPLTVPTSIQASRTMETESMISEDITEESQGLNLNMCSAWTHVCADTLRSVAVLVAAGFAYVFPIITPNQADAFASLMVSVVILVSLAPLFQGLYCTALEIRDMTIHGYKHPEEVTLTV